MFETLAIVTFFYFSKPPIVDKKPMSLTLCMEILQGSYAKDRPPDWLITDPDIKGYEFSCQIRNENIHG
jgi:hypothetical protein